MPQPLSAPLPYVLQVFEFLSTDLKKFMDRTGRGPLNPLPPMLVKVRHTVHCTGSLKLADISRVSVPASVSITGWQTQHQQYLRCYTIILFHRWTCLSLISPPGGS